MKTRWYSRRAILFRRFRRRIATQRLGIHGAGDTRPICRVASSRHARSRRSAACAGTMRVTRRKRGTQLAPRLFCCTRCLAVSVCTRGRHAVSQSAASRSDRRASAFHDGAVICLECVREHSLIMSEVRRNITIQKAIARKGMPETPGSSLHRHRRRVPAGWPASAGGPAACDRWKSGSDAVLDDLGVSAGQGGISEPETRYAPRRSRCTVSVVRRHATAR